MTEFLMHKSGGQITNKSTVRKYFDGLEDGRYKITVTKSNKRSLPQNSFLHGVLIPEFRKALNSVGYNEVKTNEQAKLIMKSMFLQGEIVNELTGEVIPFIKDTHLLTTGELNVLIDEVIRFASENMNYQIPYPNEQTELFNVA